MSLIDSLTRRAAEARADAIEADAHQPVPLGPDAWEKAIPDRPTRFDPALFANPCARFNTPPPTPIPPDGILKTAPNAWKGIQLKCLAENLPAVTRTATERPLIGGSYKLFPALARQPDGTESTVYWTAYNTQTKRAEFIVGPDSLTTFTSEPVLFEAAAGNAYMNGEPNRWQLESMKSVDAFMREGVTSSAQHLASSWLAAVQDGNWWMANAAAAGGLAGASGIAGADAIAAEDIGTHTPLASSGGLAAHEGGVSGAHLLEKHVGKLDAELVDRANRMSAASVYKPAFRSREHEDDYPRSIPEYHVSDQLLLLPSLVRGLRRRRRGAASQRLRERTSRHDDRHRRGDHALHRRELLERRDRRVCRRTSRRLIAGTRRLPGVPCWATHSDPRARCPQEVIDGNRT